MSIPIEKGTIMSIPIEKGTIVSIPIEKSTIVSIPIEKGTIVSIPIEKGTIMSIPIEVSCNFGPKATATIWAHRSRFGRPVLYCWAPYLPRCPRALGAQKDRGILAPLNIPTCSATLSRHRSRFGRPICRGVRCIGRPKGSRHFGAQTVWRHRQICWAPNCVVGRPIAEAFGALGAQKKCGILAPQQFGTATLSRLRTRFVGFVDVVVHTGVEKDCRGILLTLCTGEMSCVPK